MSARAKRARLDHVDEGVDGPRGVGEDAAVRTDAPEESSPADADAHRSAQRSATEAGSGDGAPSPCVGMELPVGYDRAPTWEETIHAVSSAIVVRFSSSPFNP